MVDMWKIVFDRDELTPEGEGTWCLMYDGYYIPLEHVRDEYEFWMRHLLGKVWFTGPVRDDFVTMARRFRRD